MYSTIEIKLTYLLTYFLLNIGIYRVQPREAGYSIQCFSYEVECLREGRGIRSRLRDYPWNHYDLLRKLSFCESRDLFGYIRQLLLS